MSHPPRGFFRFGSLFKTLLPKNPRCSPELLSLLSNFETNLTVSLKQLIPKDKKDVLTVSWMIQAMASLSKTHQSIKTLLKDLELHVSDLDENFILTYSLVSLKILELCNAFTSELNRLDQGNLLLKFALAKLETNKCLDTWNHYMVSTNQRIEKCGLDLLESMNHIPKKTKKKQSLKGKVLLRAIYGVKVKTSYILSVFATIFSASSKNLIYLTVPKELPWGQAFMELENVINPEIKITFLSDSFNVIKDLEDVEYGVKKLNEVVQEEEGSVLELVETLKKLVIELSDKFELVSKEIHCLTKIVISARDKLSESLWMTKSV